MCFFMNLHKNHKILRINDEIELKKENISLKDSSKGINENTNNLQELKNKIENEIIKIDKLYDKIDNEITKSYETKHEQLLKEENELKDKLKNEVTKVKENMELNLSKINNILKNCERLIKGIKVFKEEDNQIIKKLNYISNINKNQKEMNIIFKQEMKNINISYKENDLKYEEYYFSGLPKIKNVEFCNINIYDLKISWKLDEINILNINKNQIKYIVELKKEEEQFIKVYEGNYNSFILNNLNEDTSYEIRICLLHNHIKSNYSQIYKIQIDSIDSVILKKNERKKEFINKLFEWTGYKSMKLLYRGTRDGMTSIDFHDICDNKGKTICLFLNDKGNIFGGYSSIPWTDNGGDKISKDCFLFTLTNIYNTEPTKFPYLKERSVYHSPNYGPYFGYGADLGFTKNFLGNKGCWSNFPCSYDDVLGKGKSIFTGHDNIEYFILKELEVFELSNK